MVLASPPAGTFTVKLKSTSSPMVAFGWVGSKENPGAPG